MSWFVKKILDAAASIVPEPGSGAARSRRRSRPPTRRTPRSPVRFGLDELARRSGVPAQEIRAATPTYRSVLVAKRSGGQRELRVPDPATKAIQRHLLHGVFDRVPIHPAAHGFERGRSIVTNALPHAGQAIVVKMDLIDFFGSTSDRRVRRLFRVLGWDAESAALLTRLTTDGGSLPQGAPTSPRLANLVNVRLDSRLAALAERLGGTYTRYADDLTFSFSTDDRGAIADLLPATKKIVAQHGYRLHLDRKLQIRRQHHRQQVTGLVVNDHVGLPRARRRWLRAVEHHVYSGRPASISRDQLAGWQALDAMIDRQRRPPST